MVQWVEMGSCTSKRLSPTTAGNTINDSSKTSSSPERQITVSINDDPLHHLAAAILHSSSIRQLTVNTNNDPLRHLTATILHSSLKNDNLLSTSTKTCNVLFFTTILHLPLEQQTYRNDRDHLPSSLRRFNGLIRR